MGKLVESSEGRLAERNEALRAHLEMDGLTLLLAFPLPSVRCHVTSSCHMTL